MKRAALMGILFCLFGCGQNQGSLPANISGNYDLALFPDLLFVTSTDTNELRALDLSANPRDFLRAPNPLEPLAIPVVNRPTGLTKDVHYENGAEVQGPYIYVYSEGGGAISVVATDRSLLIEVGRISTPELVTAMSAGGPQTPGAPSTLYFATTSSSASGIAAKIFSVQVPPLNGGKALPPLTPVNMGITALAAGESVDALQVLPPSINVPAGGLLVATRSAMPAAGRTFLVSTNFTSPPVLQFGAPVKRLKINPAFAGRAEGTLVFGVLDEGGCAVISGCQPGIVAVDLSGLPQQTSPPPANPVFPRANDVTGQPMSTLVLGSGVPLGIDVVPSGQVAMPSASGTAPVTFDFLGLASSSDGSIVFFDAKTLQILNANPAAAIVDGLQAVAFGQTPQPPVVGTGPVGTSFQVSGNVPADETISIVKEGVVPGFERQSTTAGDGQTFPVSPPNLSSRAQIGDFIEVPECQAELRVVAVNPNNTLTASPLPSGCVSRTYYMLRAGSANANYVVQGAGSGYFGRIGSNQTGSYVSPRSGFSLSFAFGAEDPQASRDFLYQALLHSNFAPLAFQLDTTFCANCLFPAAVSHRVGESTVFVAYPSGNALIQFSPASMIPNQPNRNIQYYH